MPSKKELKEKKKQNIQNKKVYYDAKTLLIRYIKRYGIVLLIVTPILLVLNYVLANTVSWWQGVVPFIINLGLILLALFIGLVTYNKIDEKRERESTKEKERDPFAD